MRSRFGQRRFLVLCSLLGACACALSCSGAAMPLIGDEPGADAGAPGARPGTSDGPDATVSGNDAGGLPDTGPGLGDAAALDDAGLGPVRALPPDVLARHAIVYSGYRAGQSPETQTYPSDAQVKADLEILLQGGWTFLRLYDCSPFAETVMRLIKVNGYDIKLLSGIWLAGDKAHFDTQNQAQIQQCLELYAKYGDEVAAISVGNETLDSWSGVPVPPAELASYIVQVRALVPQPVTTDDSYLPFTLGTDGTTSYADVLVVAQNVDFLSLHVYAFSDAPYDSWNCQQLAQPPGAKRAQAMMDAALQYTKDSLNAVRTALAAHGVTRPIVIGEAGWKTSATDTTDDPTEIHRAHQVNQAMFYAPFYDWVYGASRDSSSPVAAFPFEAFDEPWKTSDDGWGLFDVNRKARYAMWSQFPNLEPTPAPPYSAADAVYYPDAGP